MTVFKQKVSVVLTLLIAMLLTPMFSSTPIHADAKALLDTNGNPVVAGYNYIMKVIDPRSKVADMYWYHSMKHDNHSSLHTSITDISLYEGDFFSFDGNGIIHEHETHKIRVGTENHYLRYHKPTILDGWKGGLSAGSKIGSINFSLESGNGRGYNLIADDGPILANMVYLSLIVTNPEAGNSFKVEFIKQ
ncbi:hypothetical protein COK81_21920 [Bacillus thuringiensis]|uniref:Uncharacterized protein n=1 Tax=Bacillus thuringiensis TaxID=1428 RepID=A0A9X7G0I0_BACTU|nr:hypothetical protein [Bacillus thuringiensis]PFT86988.1 hypothetical protein COK81_21920 [Bacillus thuringiensis]HDT6579309.1 hypothetical protein [Bacillus cereus]